MITDIIRTLKNNLWHLPKNLFFVLLNGYPSRKLILIGVTGTDGKTTTAHMIYQLLLQNGVSVGFIGTTGSKIMHDTETTKLHMTAPDPQIIQHLFKKMVSRGVTHVVLETTSHALDQYRYLGCHFKLGVFTNLSHEHLDYHKTMQKYAAAKAKLFKLSDTCVLNADDNWFDFFYQSSRGKKIITYSVASPSDYQATNITVHENLLTFDINKSLHLEAPSPYEYQVYNLLAAIAATKQLIDITPQQISDTVKQLEEPKGRREEVKNNLGITAIVDFAHTPKALDETLSSLKNRAPGKLIVLFGATGGRDQSKRPLMGQIATTHANLSILTSDDTRLEKIDKILSQIESGIQTAKEVKVTFPLTKKAISSIKKQLQTDHLYVKVPNRQDAFNLSVTVSSPKDIVIACGKGHETTILYGKTEYPWSETEAFQTAFKYKT